MTTFVKDAAERVALTFLEAFVGFLIVAPKIDVSTAQAAAAAGLAAALALVKTLIASQVSGTVSPASLAKPGDDAGITAVEVCLFVVAVCCVVALFWGWNLNP